MDSEKDTSWQNEAWMNVIAGYQRAADMMHDAAVASALDEKPTNPKDFIGTDKLPLGLVPGSALAYQSLGHLEGNLKYGLANWRAAGVRTSIYIDALLRHTLKFVNGEWEDPETHVPHLGSMGACINIIIDAYECGKLVDDRPKSAPVAAVIDRLSDVVKHLRELHKDKHPHHWVIGE